MAYPEDEEVDSNMLRRTVDADGTETAFVFVRLTELGF